MTELMEQDFVIASDELLGEVAGDIALADAGQGWHRIGKLAVGFTRFIKWVNRQPISVEMDEWKKTPANQRGFDFVFTIDIAEFDERAKSEGWEYSRRVSFKSRDWFDIFKPSVEEVFGEGSMNAKNYLNTMAKLRDAYVDMLDVPQSPGKDGKVPMNENTGKPYTTCKLFKVFDNREEAQVAYNELKQDGDGPTTSSTNHYPKSWEGSIPAMVEFVKAQKADGKSDQELMTLARLIENDRPVEAINSKDVDPVKVLAEILDMPEPTIDYTPF